jgi:hypothetical protein
VRWPQGTPQRPESTPTNPCASRRGWATKRWPRPLEALIEACRAAGDLPAAGDAAERKLQGARRLGSADRLYFALRSAANVALDEKDAVRARALLDEAEPHAEALDRQRGLTEEQDAIQTRRARLAKLDPA